MEVFFNFYFFFIIFQKKLISKDFLSKEKCLENPLLNNLEISTTEIENSNNYNIIIFSNCEITENWEIKEKNLPLYENNKRVFESEKEQIWLNDLDEFLIALDKYKKWEEEQNIIVENIKGKNNNNKK